MLTIIIGLIALKARFTSTTTGEVTADYFKLMQGSDVPEAIIKTTQCLNNLFEVPLLFYIACTLYMVTDEVSSFVYLLAWTFVISRCLQAYIHVT